MDFYLRAKALREEAGISQIRLATALNVSNQFVSNWENNQRRPNYELLVAIADFFDVTTDYLLGRVDEFGDKTK